MDFGQITSSIGIQSVKKLKAMTSFIFVLLIPILSFSFTEIGKVDVIITSKNLVNIKLTPKATIPNSVNELFLGSKQNNCGAKIVSRSADYITVDSSICQDVPIKLGDTAFLFVVGNKSEDLTSDVDNLTDSTQFEKSKVDKIHRFGGGLRFTNGLTFNNVMSSETGANSYDFTYVAESSFAFAWDYSETSQNKWGWGGGVLLTRILWNKITLGRSSSQGPFLNIPIVATTVLNTYINFIYRWSKVFLPFGLNLSFVNHQGTDDPNNKLITDLKGWVSFQIGVGYIINPNWSVFVETHSFGFWNRATMIESTEVRYSSALASGLNLLAFYNY